MAEEHRTRKKDVDEVNECPGCGEYFGSSEECPVCGSITVPISRGLKVFESPDDEAEEGTYTDQEIKDSDDEDLAYFEDLDFSGLDTDEFLADAV